MTLFNILLSRKIHVIKGGTTLQLSWTTKNQSMGIDFVFKVKCTIFWLNIGLRVYLDLYRPDFPKSTCKYFIISCYFLVQNTLF